MTAAKPEGLKRAAFRTKMPTAPFAPLPAGGFAEKPMLVPFCSSTESGLVSDAVPRTVTFAPVAIVALPWAVRFMLPERLRLPSSRLPVVVAVRPTPTPVTVRLPVLPRVVAPVALISIVRLPVAVRSMSPPEAVTWPPN